MTSFFALLRLQLLSRYADLKPKNLKAEFKNNRGRSVFKILGVIVLVIYLAVFLYFAEKTILDVLIKMGMPDLLLSMAVTMTMLGTMVMSFFFIMSSLYFGRDAAFIAALPVRPRTVLSAKLCQVWISEVGFSLIIVLPAAILYGIKVGVDPLFYLRALLAALGAPVLPIVIIALCFFLYGMVGNVHAAHPLLRAVEAPRHHRHRQRHRVPGGLYVPGL